MLKLVLIIFLSVLVSSSSALAQEKNNFSQKQISLQKENIKLGDALLLIADKANFNLSFNPHILPDSTVSFNFHNQTSRNIFAELLPTYIQFEAFGESIILQKMQKPKHKKITISGEIKNAENNKPLSDALIVEASGLASTFTDENGRFQLKIKKTQTSSLSLSISKENFKDTLLILPVKGHNILLSLWKKQLNPLPKKDYHLKNIPRILVPKSIQLRTENIQTHIYRKYQLSLLPGIGTNLKMSGVVENSYSLNIIGGYSYGNNEIEIAGAFNVNLKNVEGLQLAGFFNIVGGNFDGVQISGWGNLNFGEMKGAQVSGSYNQAATLSGTQISGGLNLVYDSTAGIQIAPFNYSLNLSGKQVGLINYADSSSGTSIGLINVIRKGGYFATEVSSNELSYLNLRLKLGTPQLYNIYSSGIGFHQNSLLRNYSFGIGSEKTTKNNRLINNELSLHWLFSGDDNNLKKYNLAKWQFLIQNKANHKVRLSIGPSANFLFFAPSLLTEENYEAIPPYSAFSSKLLGTQFEAWIGLSFSVGLRDFL